MPSMVSAPLSVDRTPLSVDRTPLSPKRTTLPDFRPPRSNEPATLFSSPLRRAEDGAPESAFIENDSRLRKSRSDGMKGDPDLPRRLPDSIERRSDDAVGAPAVPVTGSALHVSGSVFITSTSVLRTRTSVLPTMKEVGLAPQSTMQVVQS